MKMNIEKVAKNIKRFLEHNGLFVTESSVKNCLKEEVTEDEFKEIYNKVVLLQLEEEDGVTTIQLTRTTKHELDDIKKSGESYDDVVKVLLKNYR